MPHRFSARLPEDWAMQMGTTERREAERLNRGCFCITLDRHALIEALNQEVGSQDFAQELAESHPSLFSNVPAFVTAETLIEMAQVVDAVEITARLPGFREAALSWAPPIARLDFGPIGALMSYDFHVTANGPKLIEVNTNAGAAFLNAALARAQRACCADAHMPFEISPSRDFGSKIVEMFIDEWRRQRLAHDVVDPEDRNRAGGTPPARDHRAGGCAFASKNDRSLRSEVPAAMPKH
jgi:hypothetical protein